METRRGSSLTHNPSLSLPVVVQLLSRVQLFASPWTTACQAPLSSTIFLSLLKFRSIESVMQSKHLILCHPLLVPSIFASIRVFSSEQALHIRWPKYQSFSSSNSQGLTAFRIDWCDLLTVQGTLKSLLQHYSLKPSVLWPSAFFMVQLSDPCMTTGKTIVLFLLSAHSWIWRILIIHRWRWTSRQWGIGQTLCVGCAISSLDSSCGLGEGPRGEGLWINQWGKEQDEVEFKGCGGLQVCLWTHWVLSTFLPWGTVFSSPCAKHKLKQNTGEKGNKHIIKYNSKVK